MTNLQKIPRSNSWPQKRKWRLEFFLLIIIIFSINSCLPKNSKPYAIENATVLVDIVDWPDADFISWSPNGDKLAITGVGNRVDISKVRIYDLTTNEIYFLLDTEEFVPRITITSWSPDGKKVVFIAGGINFTKGIWVSDVSGDEEPQYLGEGYDAAWSKTGEIAIERGDVRDDLISIYILDPETSEEKGIFDQSGILLQGMSWSPDGTKLAVGLADGQDYENDNVYILDTITGKIEKITTDNKNKHPEWSPFGDMIAYLKFGPVFSIHIMNSDGSCDVELLPDAPNLWNPIWSPDGRNIAFVSNGDVYITDLVDVFGEEFLTEGLPCE